MNWSAAVWGVNSTSRSTRKRVDLGAGKIKIFTDTTQFQKGNCYDYSTAFSSFSSQPQPHGGAAASLAATHVQPDALGKWCDPWFAGRIAARVPQERNARS